MQNMRLLLVDDDTELCGLLAPLLAALGPTVTCAHSIAEAMDELTRADFHLVILDVQLPDGSGFSIASHLHRHSPQTGIIMLTRLADPAWQVAGYDVGADVYLPKPISPDVLCAAVRSLAGRLHQGMSASVSQTSHWRLEGDGWRLFAPDGRWVALNQAERVLARCFFSQAQRVVSRQELVRVLEQDDPGNDAQRLDMLIHRLRRKVEAAGLPRLPLQSVRGQGYVLMMPTASETMPAAMAHTTSESDNPQEDERRCGP